jgi:hypothetical protein
VVAVQEDTKSVNKEDSQVADLTEGQKTEKGTVEQEVTNRTKPESLGEKSEKTLKLNSPEKANESMDVEDDFKEPSVQNGKPAKDTYDADMMFNSNPNRTEVIIGQIYHKPFESLFDDQTTLLGYTPHSIIKILCNWSDTHIVGIQVLLFCLKNEKFHYMTSQGHIIEGRFYGEHKVRLNNLKSGEWEIPLDERITNISCSYSKGKFFCFSGSNWGQGCTGQRLLLAVAK